MKYLVQFSFSASLSYMLHSEKNSEIKQGHQQRQWDQRQTSSEWYSAETAASLLLRDICEGQLFPAADCCRLAFWEYFLVPKQTEREKRGVPNCSGKTVELGQYGLGLGRIFSFPPSEVAPPCINRWEFPSLCSPHPAQPMSTNTTQVMSQRTNIYALSKLSTVFDEELKLVVCFCPSLDLDMHDQMIPDTV